MKNRIKELRSSMNISQRKLASSLGISQQAIANYETGERTPRNEEIWKKLSDYFHVPINYIQGYGESLSDIKSSILRLLSDYWSQPPFDDELIDEGADRLHNSINEFCRYKKIDLDEELFISSDGKELEEYDYEVAEKKLSKLFNFLLTQDYLIELYKTIDTFDNNALANSISKKIDETILPFKQKEEKNKNDRIKKNLGVDIEEYDKKVMNLVLNLGLAFDRENKEDVQKYLNDFIDYLKHIQKQLK